MSDTPPPWKKKNPRKASARRPLTPAQKASAKAAAEAAGRPYPNLIDNMRAARSGEKPARTATKGATKRRKADDGDAPTTPIDPKDSPLI